MHMPSTHVLDRWMYRGGRPHGLARVLNRTWATVAASGFGPKRLATLEVSGRRTGKPISFPVVVVDHKGERYLVAMLGEKARWVENVRAAGGHALLSHGVRDRVRLVEVDPADRAPILRRYLAVAPGARTHIPVDQDASDEEFERVAPQIPVFRVTLAANSPD